MANEAVIVELLGDRGDVIRFTCADEAGIEKGTLCQLTDARTASASSANTDVWAGIAAHEKEANDGSVTIGCYTKGIFILKEADSGSISAGKMVKLGGANKIIAASDEDFEAGDVIGKTLEDIGQDGTGQVLVGGF